MLNLYKLEIFNTVAMEGNFSRAAERLLLTQPAVSQHMRDLEEILGTELFVRGPRGVRHGGSGRRTGEDCADDSCDRIRTELPVCHACGAVA